MKKRIIILLMLVTLSTVSTAQTKTKEITVQTKIYCDHCKECSTCQPHIEHELNFTKGVVSFSVNVESQTIKVVYNPKKASPQDIRKAIANCGYDADDLIADPKAVAKLDGCCQKQ